MVADGCNLALFFRIKVSSVREFHATNRWGGSEAVLKGVLKACLSRIKHA
jgi:hypothetical protein